MDWVRQWLARLTPGSQVLDYASGGGRHARLALELGHRVLAVDRDESALCALAAGAGAQAALQTRVLDLEAGAWPFGSRRFDAIVVTNYLFRPRWPLMAGLLAPGGMLLHATFARGNEAFGKPSNPSFLLAPGELLRLASMAGLHVLAYEDGVIETPTRARVQRVCALRPPLRAVDLRL